MLMSKHTPGPWKITYMYGQGLGEETIIRGSDESAIAKMLFTYREKAETDAQLIIRAPAMKAVLEEIKDNNSLRNDEDAYLFYLVKWALGEIDDKPEPQEFGLEPLGEHKNG